MGTTLTTLANGITVICEQRPGTGMVSALLAVRNGAVMDDDAKAGLTQLTQEAMQLGTATRTRAQIADEFAKRGTALSSSASQGGVTFGMSARDADMGDVFALFGDIVRNPAFNQADVDAEKARQAQYIAMQAANAAGVAGQKLVGEIFRGQKLARSVLGRPETLASITQADVAARHRDLFSRPEDIVVSFSGDIDPAAACKLVEDHFGDLKGAGRTPDFHAQFIGGDYREANNNDQLAINIAFPAANGKALERFDYMLLNELIGGGMSAPLFQEIREKRGLVYGVSSSYGSEADVGIFRISATTGQGKVGQLIPAAIGLLGDCAHKGFTQDELDVAVARLERKLLSGRETSSAAASGNLSQFINQGRMVAVEETVTRLKQVGVDDVRRAAALLLQSGQYALAGVGPQDQMPAKADIEKMMRDAVAGLALPPATPRAPLATQAFNSASSGTAGVIAPVPQLTTLPNGLRILSINRPGPVSCGAWVGVGANNETPAQNGVTHMIEHMMFKGTRSYPAGSIDKIVERELLAGLNAYTSNDRTAYYFYNLAPDGLEKTVDICGQMVFEADLSEDEFSGKIENGVKGPGERDVVLEEIKQYNDQPNSRQFYQLYAQAYPAQAAGRTILGTADSLTAMNAKDLQDYRDTHYVPNNVVFCAVGPVDHAAFVKIVEDRYGHLARAPLPQPESMSYVGGLGVFEHEKLAACRVIIAAKGVHENHADSITYDILAGIMGQGESSRLSAKLVHGARLAPYVSAHNVENKHGGLFLIGTETAPENVRTVIGAMYDELRAVADNVTQDELDMVKARLKLSVLASRESNQSLCNINATSLLSAGRVLEDAALIAKIDGVRVSDVKRMARRVLNSTPTISMAVPEKTDRALLPHHQEVIAMRDGKKYMSGPSYGAPAP